MSPREDRAPHRRYRRDARRARPCRGRGLVAHSRCGRVARARAGRRPAASERARQRGAQRHDRRRAGALRPRRPGPYRRLLPGRGADRRRRQHQPDRHRPASHRRQALPRLLRLRLPLLRGAARDPLPPRAHAPDAGGEGGFRERSGDESARGLPAGRALRAGDGPLRLSLRCGARALPPRLAAPRPQPRRGDAPPPASNSTADDDPPVTPAPSAETMALLRGPIGAALTDVYPRFAAKFLGDAGAA